jgi:hypothetical protein
MPISETEIVHIIEKRIGKSIEVKTPTFETGANKLLQALVGGKAGAQGGARSGFELASEGDSRADIVHDTVERLILFYNRRGLKGSPNILRLILGREPTTVEEWVDSVAPK